MPEGFADATTAVPDICSKYGYRFNPGHIAMLKQLMKDSKITSNKETEEQLRASTILSEYRQYTPADCTNLGGTIIQGTPYPPGVSLCFKIKDSTRGANGQYNLSGENVDVAFSQVCSGLNKNSHTPPVECNVNGSTLGMLNKQFSFKLNNTSYLIPDDTYRFYTQEECDSLQDGFWIGIDFLKKVFNIEMDTDAFLQAHGKNVGFCSSTKAPGTMYSFACAAPPSLANRAASTISAISSIF